MDTTADKDEGASLPPLPPSPPPPSQQRRLTRSSRRWIAGVARGIADYLDVNVWIVRAVFVFLVFAGGSGVVLYILGAVVMPRETDVPGSSLFERVVSNPSRYGWWPWAAFVVALVVVTSGFPWHESSLLALLLIGLGIYLLWDRSQTETSAAEASTVPPQATPSGITTPAYGGEKATTAPVADAHRRPLPPRERSSLALLTVGVAMLATGVTVWLAKAGTIGLELHQILAVPTIVLGLGLLVGSFIGRARSLAFLALLLLPFLSASSVADVPFSSRTGVNEYRPTNVQDLENEYSLGAGRLIIDLSHVRPETLYAIHAHTGAGQVVVVIPRDFSVDVDATAGVGVVEALGQRDDGTSPRVHAHTSPSLNDSVAGPGELQLKLRTGFGQVFVTDNPDAKEARR